MRFAMTIHVRSAGPARQRCGDPRALRWPAVCVDFGTATTFDVVSREGEYLGGSLMTGIEISLEALSERGARLPKVDLAPPKSVIGKNTVDAIRSGVVFGYAGAVDAILRRLYDELASVPMWWPQVVGRARGALHRGDRGGRRPADAHRAAVVARAQLVTASSISVLPLLSPSLLAGRSMPIMGSMSPQLTDSWMLGPLEVPNRVLLAPLAGIGNWFVRLQAKRYGAGMAVSEMVSSHAIHHNNERTCTEMLRIHPTSAPWVQVGRSRSSCSVRIRRDALGGGAWPRLEPT